jgi:type II secretory pathway pseudopilin PulG
LVKLRFRYAQDASRLKAFRMKPCISVLSRQHAQRGYILITLMLFVTLLAIAAAAVAPRIALQIQRDREEELIHRGVQYSRAIRRYVKKTGGYPVRIEQLENTNHIRFLRKRYKDPITGQDFKILHLGEVKLTFVPGIAGANVIAGANPAPATPALGGAGTQALGGAGTQALGGAGSQGLTGRASAPAIPATQDNSGQDTNPPNSGAPSQSQSNQGTAAGGNDLPATVFGGGPIVGVVSTSKAASIREFNKKNHYNQWQFIYDPATDRGGLLSTPNQPPLQVAAPNEQNGQPSQPGTNGISGGSSGTQNQPTQPTPLPVQQPPQQQ